MLSNGRSWPVLDGDPNYFNVSFEYNGSQGKRHNVPEAACRCKNLTPLIGNHYCVGILGRTVLPNMKQQAPIIHVFEVTIRGIVFEIDRIDIF